MTVYFEKNKQRRKFLFNILQRLRCTNTLGSVNTANNQRAYACHLCAKRFKLPLFMMQKSPCIICSKHIPPTTSSEVSLEKREARLCQKHGTIDYPQTFQCIFCQKFQTIPTETTSTPGKDPLPLFICCECWLAGGGTESRCARFDF